jgi:hypothetical protein
MTNREVLAMRTVFYKEIHTGTAKHASRPFSLLETMLIENKGEDGNVQTERVIWTWKVHEVALHEASHKEGLLMMGSKETLLKKVSEEVTRKAQEKLSAYRSKSTP